MKRLGRKGLAARLTAASLTAVLALAAAAVPLSAQRYEHRGKRDPFVDLSKTQKKAAPSVVLPPPFSQRPPGLSGLLISEVSVVGTATSDKQRIVILRGTDNFTYVAREGSKLFDGFVESISTNEVAFVREVFDTAGKKTSSKVVKQYYTEAR